MSDGFSAPSSPQHPANSNSESGRALGRARDRLIRGERVDWP